MRGLGARAALDHVAAQLSEFVAPEGWRYIPREDLDQERAAVHEEMGDNEVSDPVALACGIVLAIGWLRETHTVVDPLAMADLIRAADVLLGMDDAEVEA